MDMLLANYSTLCVVLHALADDDKLSVLNHLNSLLRNGGIVNSGGSRIINLNVAQCYITRAFVGVNELDITCS